MEKDYISKVTSSTLLEISLGGVLGRFFIRLRLNKQHLIDDGFLIFGTCCMVCSLGLTFMVIDTMYMVEALTLCEKIALALLPDFQDRVFYYRKVNDASLVLTHCKIVSIKSGFLALFRRPIDRLQALILY